MFYRIWNFIKDLNLTFYLLLTISGCLFIGGLYAQFRHAFFQTLSGSRIQDWLLEHIASHPQRTWWIPVLFAAMGLLGLNIFACTCHRLASLIRPRKTYWHWKFLHSLIPSIIHLFFLIILIGHLMTFTLGKWNRIPISEGKSISLTDADSAFTVDAIHNAYYPDDSLLAGRISQTSVHLKNQQEESISLSHLNVTSYNTNFLLLGREKQKKAFLKKNDMLENSADEETCNEAHVYYTKKEKDKRGIFLIQISDPGLYPIIIGLFSILVLMIFYFIKMPDNSIK